LSKALNVTHLRAMEYHLPYEIKQTVFVIQRSSHTKKRYWL